MPFRCVRFCIVCVLSCIRWVCALVGFVCGYWVIGYTRAFAVPRMWCLGVLDRAAYRGVVDVLGVLGSSMYGEGVLD
jgi:hypothetical protein